MKQSSQLRIHQREKEAQELRQAIFSLTVSANAHSFDHYMHAENDSPPGGL